METTEIVNTLPTKTQYLVKKQGERFEEWLESLHESSESQLQEATRTGHSQVLKVLDRSLVDEKVRELPSAEVEELLSENFQQKFRYLLYGYELAILSSTQIQNTLEQVRNLLIELIISFSIQKLQRLAMINSLKTSDQRLEATLERILLFEYYINEMLSEKEIDLVTDLLVQNKYVFELFSDCLLLLDDEETDVRSMEDLARDEERLERSLRKLKLWLAQRSREGEVN